MPSGGFRLATAHLGRVIELLVVALVSVMVGIEFRFFGRWMVHISIIVMTTELIVAVRIKIVTIRVQKRPIRINVEALIIVVPAIIFTIVSVVGPAPTHHNLAMVALLVASRPPLHPLLR